jgi:hypothetical protein
MISLAGLFGDFWAASGPMPVRRERTGQSRDAELAHAMKLLLGACRSSPRAERLPSARPMPHEAGSPFQPRHEGFPRWSD